MQREFIRVVEQDGKLYQVMLVGRPGEQRIVAEPFAARYNGAQRKASLLGKSDDRQGDFWPEFKV